MAETSFTKLSTTTRAGELAAQNNEIFRLLVDSVKEYAIFVLDPDGHVINWNAGAQAIKGYTRDEIVGQHFSKFYLPEAIESGWPSRALTLAQREGRFSDEGWRAKKDGSDAWVPMRSLAMR